MNPNRGVDQFSQFPETKQGQSQGQGQDQHGDQHQPFQRAKHKISELVSTGWIYLFRGIIPIFIIKPISWTG